MTITVVNTASDHDMVIRTLGHHGARVALQNLGDATNLRLLADLDRGVDVHNVSVYGLTEASDRDELLDQFLDGFFDGWDICRYEVAGGPAVPILWDTYTWRPIDVDYVAAVPSMWVGQEGAGPTTSKAKGITRLVLRHRETKADVVFLCTHAIPSVTRKHLSRAERRARRRNYRRHMRAIARTVRATDLPVVLFIDTNAPRWFNLLHPLKRAGLRGWTQQGTHGRRAIDHVLVRAARP